jgi:molybdenum cofactor cytidylyltransferase
VLSAIVLAAGESRRMGGCIKALLPLGDSCFVENIVHCLFRVGTGEVLVVLGSGHEIIEREAHIPDARIVVNGQWRTGQLSSLRAGIRNLSDQSAGVLFTPVDHPLVREKTYGILIDAWMEDRSRIVIPRFRERKGHPAIFPKRVFERVLEGELPNGARDVIYEEWDSVSFIPVDDPGVVWDIDTPDDYTRLIGPMPGSEE